MKTDAQLPNKALQATSWTPLRSVQAAPELGRWAL